jgi:hypothetical protein
MSHSPGAPALPSYFSRRDFLKLSSLSLAGLLLTPALNFPELSPNKRGLMHTSASDLQLLAAGAAGLPLTSAVNFQELLAGMQGRVIPARVVVRSAATEYAPVVGEYFENMILPISEVTLGPEGESHNRVWYHIRQEGYTHSGDIQPVRTDVQTPNPDIPPIGRLAEVSVPYTDAHRGPGRNFPVAYRFYYETTHWVVGLENTREQEHWYRILDDKRDELFYCPASHLRLIPPEEITPLNPDIPLAGKRLEVRTTEQVVIAYEWEQPVFITRAATGAKFSNGNYSTPAGRHLTFHKRPSRHMAAGNLAYNGYDLPGVPWITYFTKSGIAIHGTYWHNNYGRPRSHGCINLTAKAAKWIYRWTLPSVPFEEQRVYEDYGTPLDVITERD